MGSISCEAQENNQLEIHKDIIENKELTKKIINKSNIIKEKKPQKINKSKTGYISHKILIKKELPKKKYYIKNIVSPKRKANTKEKCNIKFNKEIKSKMPNNKIRNTISLENKNTQNFLKKQTKFQKKTFNKFKNKKNEIKNIQINYNNIFNNISNDFIEDELIIVNNNDGLDESFHFLDNNINKNNKTENNDLKEKIIKTKNKIINIKNEMKMNKNKSGKNIVRKNIDENKIIKKKITNKINVNNLNINTIEETRTNNLNNNNSQNKQNGKKKEENNNINSPITKEENNLNTNLIEIEINEIIRNSYNNIKSKNKKNKEKKRINNIYYTDSDIGPNIVKKDFFKFNTYDDSKNNIIKNKNNEEIINKIKEINNKINNKNSPEKRKTYPIFDSKYSKIKKSETMDNKQIKNNIPSYRRGHSKSNNFYCSTVNSCTFDKNKIKKTSNLKNLISLENSFNRSLCNSYLKSKKIKNNNFYSNIYSFKKREKSNNGNSKDNISKYSMQQSYLNNSSLINISTNDIISLNKKNMKNQRLFNIISKNIIKKDNFNEQNSINLSHNDKKDDIEEILFSSFRDVAEIDISPININETLIDKNLLKSHINDKIILNYNKLENFDNSQILYDGIIYKIVENKNKGYKITERYFQIKKNCFRYYNNVEKAKIDSDNPLVQFDIRHIKDLNIIDNKVFKQYKINEKEIKFTFCIYLNQNDDFFVFVLNNEKMGNAIFNFLNLLKNYYEDKK